MCKQTQAELAGGGGGDCWRVCRLRKRRWWTWWSEQRSLEVELAATLIYWASHHPYRQIRDVVASLPAARVNEIVELGLRHRGKHDESLRDFMRERRYGSTS